MYTLPTLPYAYDALEPHIDARTMEIHYGKHHQAYCDNTNKALTGTVMEDKPIEDILKDLSQVPEEKRMAVRNHGGGYANHSFFWTVMSPKGGGEPKGRLGDAISQTFGSFDAFREQFTNAAATLFGSGWAWLVVDREQNTESRTKLIVESTSNQDSPLSEGKTPILCLDVWEHAYYLKYQNKRPDYIAAFWNTVNWEKVEEYYKKAIK